MGLRDDVLMNFCVFFNLIGLNCFRNVQLIILDKCVISFVDLNFIRILGMEVNCFNMK